MPTIRPAHVGWRWWVGGVVAVLAVSVAGVTLGPVRLAPSAVGAELLDHLPLLSIDSGLSARQAAIVWDLRLPRVVLGLLVGAMLAVAGASYQGVFRNPLADPYLLGVAAGAGLGATFAIVAGLGGGGGVVDLVPLIAFGGALVAVALTYALGASGDRLRSAASLVLAGVAVASFFTALQTYVQQRNADTIREVYSWILGRLSTAGWNEVLVLVPYVAVTAAVLLLAARSLDVLAVGEEEAAALGLHPVRTRVLVVVAASLGTAAAVSVSGLIGFVGIIVPHTIRLLAGSSHRVILPLSLLFGAAFLAGADLLARTVVAPAELPIGVVTAFFGAPFFVLVLRTSRRVIG
ncbi:MAG: iron ABC transporter permease [Acidimicrobiales bacterium]|nr:iron ABC transporter permease [Acidimicrobiales bacterium]